MGQRYEFGSVTVPRGPFSYASQLPRLWAAWGRSGSVLKKVFEPQATVCTAEKTGRRALMRALPALTPPLGS